MTRWVTILKRVAVYIGENPKEAGCITIKSNARYSGQSVGEYLAKLDVRDVGKLRELVPKAFPHPLRGNKMLWAKHNDKGEWIIERST